MPGRRTVERRAVTFLHFSHTKDHTHAHPLHLSGLHAIPQSAPPKPASQTQPAARQKPRPEQPFGHESAGETPSAHAGPAEPARQTHTPRGVGSDAGAAAEAWLTAVLAASEWLPPNDEQVAAIGVQCAKALAHADGLEAARAVLKAAYASHSISFGPGVRLFARRYEADLLLPPEAPEELLITLVT